MESLLQIPMLKRVSDVQKLIGIPTLYSKLIGFNGSVNYYVKT